MKYFYAKLHAPRADFGQTMTPAEGQLMQQHAGYLAGFAAKGWLIVFGPVAAAEGFFGVAIWELPDDADLAAILAEDPAIRADQGFRYETHPMPRAIVRK